MKWWMKPQIRIWGRHFNDPDELVKKEVVIFKNVRGFYVPFQPWPQSFFITRDLTEYDMMELRPLTLTSFFIHVFRNFVTMNINRIKLLLYYMGFMHIQHLGCRDWEWRWKFWIELKERKRSNKVYDAYNNLMRVFKEEKQKRSKQ